MSKNSVKSYGSTTNRNRTINNKKNNNKNKREDKSIDKSLENTTRIRIDDNRINDAESLDTSFLEGRLDKKSKDNIKTKEKILKERKQVLFNFEIIKCVFFGLAFICVFVLGFVFLRDSSLFKIKNISSIERKKDTDEKKKDVENNIDKNYVFVGDYYIDKYNFDNLDYYYVKSSNNDLTTGKLLDDMKKMIYDFNPSIVFIQVGSNDLKDNRSIEDITNDYKKIIDNIKDNRPYAKIVINSLLPINKDNDDFDSDRVNDSYSDDVVKLNSELKKLADDKNIDYIDLYNVLSEDNKLKDDYTDNGIDLNDEGYKKIEIEIKKYLE